jgi:hypothetical protein
MKSFRKNEKIIAMAFGVHWEWRGFGSVSDAFFERYGVLAYEFGPWMIEDIYIWTSGLEVNLKIREGVEGGLKIKRPFGRDGRFERWVERPEDLYTLPLERKGWEVLAAELAGAGLVLGPYPEEAPGHDQLLFLLERAGCQSVLVVKERGGRWWQGPNGRVLVEWSAIEKPQALLSVSLESEDLSGEEGGETDEEAKADLQAAIEAFHLDHERLIPMNYMDALAHWINGRQIS